MTTSYSNTPIQQKYAVCLDGKRAKTPGRSNLAVESKCLAQGLAFEWAMQKTDTPFDPTNMPLVHIYIYIETIHM